MASKKPNVTKIIHKIFSKPAGFIFFIVFSVLATGFLIAAVSISQAFVNKLYTANGGITISLYVAPLVLVILGLCGSLIAMGRFKSNITANITNELKEEAYLALLQAEMAEFDKDNYEKEVAGFVKNVEQVSEVYIGKNILSFISTMILVVGFFIFGLIMEPIFAFIALAVIPLYTTADKTCTMFMNKANARYEEELKNNSEVTYDTIKNLKNIKLLSGIDKENERYEEINSVLSKTTHTKNVGIVISSYVLPLLFIGITLAVMFGVGGLALENDGRYITIGDFVSFVIITPVIFLATYRAFHYHLKPSYVENEVLAIEKITELRSEIRSEPISSLDDIHNIKFEDVSDKDDSKVLSKVSLEIKQGEKVGILSLEKETRDKIFNLITKIEKPDEGTVSINNCELNKINAKYLRTLIAAVYDDSHVFNDTIMNNICYSNPFDEYKYNDALYRSGIKQIVAGLEDKDQTVLDASVKDDFNTRVIFANAFYQDRKIYLLNDACPGLDPSIENELVNEVFKLKSKTVILETDKAYLLSKCDKIFVLSEGKIIESGSYKELMSNKQSNYYRLIKGPVSRKQKVS